MRCLFFFLPHGHGPSAVLALHVVVVVVVVFFRFVGELNQTSMRPFSQWDFQSRNL